MRPSPGAKRIQVAVTPENVDALRESLATAHDGAIVKASIHTADGNDEAPTEYEGVATEVRHRMLPTPFVAIADRTVTGYDGPEETVLGGVDA
ncbi:TrmB family transcriptional regulator sugar-binding domain-containing protein [Halorubrum sp. 48-1-W]|uniref:TrmB family transcriptional regulator sugar-binding domain-containing protein n=1 Tax=Halorubrum sp. 48-1-W TaxID=2249761 RepID=UPI0013006844|nr:TrmB family transcriptional regulator sugar-binding domain-containing protein [Halorubrum sp. 48-1-W]